MNKITFLKEISEELEIESIIELNTKFKELEEWDSLNLMVLIGFVSKKFSVSLNAADIEESNTFNDLITKIGDNYFNE